MSRTERSKYLSWALRHGLDELGLIPDAEGFVRLSDLLDSSRGRCGTLGDVLDIVEKCPKQRFAIRDCGEAGLYIRANQGHSRGIGDMIESDHLLKRIDAPIPNVFHGSYEKHRRSIESSGLDRMGRKHIHLAKSVDSKSGKRRNCNLMVFVDMDCAMADGMVFYESANGVVLTEGFDGIIPPCYLTFRTCKPHQSDRVFY